MRCQTFGHEVGDYSSLFHLCRGRTHIQTMLTAALGHFDMEEIVADGAQPQVHLSDLVLDRLHRLLEAVQGPCVRHALAALVRQGLDLFELLADLLDGALERRHLRAWRALSASTLPCAQSTSC